MADDNTERDIQDVITYYRGRYNNPNRYLEARLYRELKKLDPGKLPRVLGMLYDNIPQNKGLNVADIRLAGDTLSAHEVTNARAWTCDLCGLEFKYKATTSKQDMLSEIYDRCPRCGLDPERTIEFRRAPAYHSYYPKKLEETERAWKNRSSEWDEKYAWFYDRRMLAMSEDELSRKHAAAIAAATEELDAVKNRIYHAWSRGPDGNRTT